MTECSGTTSAESDKRPSCSSISQSTIESNRRSSSMESTEDSTSSIEINNSSSNSNSSSSNPDQLVSDNQSSTLEVSQSSSQESPKSQEDATGEEELWAIWAQLVNDWANQYKKRTQYVKDLVRKGVPQHFRGLVWQLLSNAQTNPVRDRYSELLRQESPCEKIIKRDIARTFPEHDFFRDKNGAGQKGLFNVMKAYSNYDAEVGYCQGSAFLVGVLLMNMPEEDAFSVFTRLMEDYRLREMYKPTMAELGLCIYQLECLVQELLPELHRHFQMQNYHCSMYASGWFLTLFTSCLPLPVALRVLDLFLCEGMEAIFRVSIAILMLSKEQLLKLDMEGLLRYFQKQVPLDCELDPDYLISLACGVRYDAKKLRKLSKDYGVLKSKEQEEQVELRRLRTENRILRQRIEMLEQESAELADKLIQGQVSRAQEAEDNYVIKRELSALTQREDELRVQLEAALEQVKELKAERKREYGLEAQLVIDSLQEELVAVKLREAEAAEELRLLRDKCLELEDCNRRLQEQPPDQAVAQLQEELIAVKLREAEANLAMKELRLKISELNNMWQEHLTQAHSPNGTGTSLCDGGSALNSLGDCSQPNSLEASNGPVSNSSASNLALSVSASPLKMLGYSFKKSADERQLANEQNRLRQELMSTKLREAEASAELKELRQRVMELETQNQVSLNQIRRQADELHKCEEFANSFAEQQRQMQHKLAEEQRRYIDLDSRCKEQAMMNRIKDLEQTQLIAELRQKVSAYEVKREERVTVEKLRQAGQEPADSTELQNRMAELQSEMFRLEVSRNKLGLQSESAFISN